MNPNNWLAFPLSPSHSLAPHLQSSQSSQHHHHRFSLGLVNNDTIDVPFHIQDWNMISSEHHGGGEVPKVADFLGVSRIDQETQHQDLGVAAFGGRFCETSADHRDGSKPTYLFNNASSSQNHHLLPPPAVKSSTSATSTPSSEHDPVQHPNSLQSLTLSMGSCGNNNNHTNKATSTSVAAIVPVEDPAPGNTAEPAPRRTLDTFGQRTSIYRGVTRHRWTGRYEAHLWDNSCRREGQSRKGRQVYLGGYDKEDKAARAYDMAALKYWGTSTTTNFPISHYEKELEEMKHMTRQEFVASIRRKSSGFSRGASMYRGVTRHHQHGRWQARIGRVAGNKDLYLGTFSTEEEAAEAYDIAAIKFRGLNAVTNFDMNRYDVKSILESNTLPIGGGAARRLKEAHALETSRKREELITLGPASAATFIYSGGSSSNASARIHPYAMLQQQPPPTLFEQQPQPLLALHSQDMSHQDFYVQTQLQLHQQQQQQQQHAFLNPHSQHQQMYGGSYSPALLHGLLNVGGSSSSSVTEHNGGGGGGSSYYGGAAVIGYGMNFNAATAGGSVGSGERGLPLVKVDYDVPPSSDSASYGGWSGETIQGSNPGMFTMWND